MARALQGPPFPPCLPSFSPPTAAVPKSARPIPSPELPRSRVLLHARTTPLIYLFIPVPLSLFQLLSLSRSLARPLVHACTHTHTHSSSSSPASASNSGAGAALEELFLATVLSSFFPPNGLGRLNLVGSGKLTVGKLICFVRDLRFSLGFRPEGLR